MRKVAPVLIIAVVSLGAAIGVIMAMRPGDGPVSFSSGVLFVTPRNPVDRDSVDRSASIDVEVATTPSARAQGLMGRTELAPGHGMAFVFPDSHMGGFWMKNTLLPLRVAFWDASGTVVAILDMTPCVEDTCPRYVPDVPYVGAIEASKETFEDAALEVGSTVVLQGVDPAEAT